tara:strand:+ start:114 stop:377 length:264 start_codon:yes stop_codon:yes gene_type:complete
MSVMDRKKPKNVKLGSKITTKTLKENGHLSQRADSGAWEVIKLTPKTVQLYKLSGKSSLKPSKKVDIEVVTLKQIKKNGTARTFWLV